MKIVYLTLFYYLFITKLKLQKYNLLINIL